MTTKTAFRPETDAFAFDNSWPIDGWELNGIRRYLAGEHNGVVRALANSGLAHLIVREVHERHLLDDVLTAEHLTAYGLCGGMAFAALDYYMQDWVVLQSTGPHDHPQHNQSAGLTASPTSGACVTLEYTARNDSFSRCPPLALRVRGRLLGRSHPDARSRGRGRASPSRRRRLPRAGGVHPT